MQAINTILSRSDQVLLEDTLVRYGRIISFAQLYMVMGDVTTITKATARQRIARLVDKGWLIRLKSGLYLIVTDISTLGSNDLSEYVIAQALNNDSYISSESALQYHGMYDQMLSAVTSITDGYARDYQIGETTYAFASIKKDLYFGFAIEIVNNTYKVQIAGAEKALLDMLYFGRSAHAVNMVLEKLRDYQHQLDFAKLENHAAKYGVGIVRLLGFLLDQLDIDTTSLLRNAKVHGNTYNKMTSKSSEFNAKWRLYYDTRALI